MAYCICFRFGGTGGFCVLLIRKSTSIRRIHFEQDANFTPAQNVAHHGAPIGNVSRLDWIGSIEAARSGRGNPPIEFPEIISGFINLWLRSLIPFAKALVPLSPRLTLAIRYVVPDVVLYSSSEIVPEFVEKFSTLPAASTTCE